MAADRCRLLCNRSDRSAREQTLSHGWDARTPWPVRRPVSALLWLVAYLLDALGPRVDCGRSPMCRFGGSSRRSVSCQSSRRLAAKVRWRATSSEITSGSLALTTEREPCGTSRAIAFAMSRALLSSSAASVASLSPSASLRSTANRSVRWGSGRAGRRCVRCSGPHETALRQPAPSPSFLHSAALRSVTSAPAESAPALRCARQGAGLASTAARTRQSLRLVPRGGSAIPLPLVALRLRSLRSLRPGPHGRALARDRAARLRLLSRAVTDPPSR